VCVCVCECVCVYAGVCASVCAMCLCSGQRSGANAHFSATMNVFCASRRSHHPRLEKARNRGRGRRGFIAKPLSSLRERPNTNQYLCSSDTIAPPSLGQRERERERACVRRCLRAAGRWRPLIGAVDGDSGGDCCRRGGGTLLKHRC